MLTEIIQYTNSPTKEDENITMAEVYGSEKFAHFIYSHILMQQPKTIIELGTGLGTTSLMMAQAAKETGCGMVYTLDDGRDWNNMSIWLHDKFKDHSTYFEDLVKKMKVDKFIKLVNHNLNLTGLRFNPTGSGDLVYADATPAGAPGCIDVLHAYLPIMAPNSSIFIDRASTVNHSYLLLERIIEQLNGGKIPSILLKQQSPLGEHVLRRCVAQSKFTLIHLTEKNANKVNRAQNSVAWIKIEPVDVFFGDDVHNIWYVSPEISDGRVKL